LSGRGGGVDIARYMAAAYHIASKLARHFVADDPPPALLKYLIKVFRMTDGDLYAVSFVPVDAAESWDRAARKLRSPEEFVVAAFRALRRPAAGQIVRMMNALDASGGTQWLLRRARSLGIA
jgi:uncharacterized protein (DUF1800 family)